MYNRFQLAKKYLRYYLTASNGKGHGIHSPFVFDFIKNVLNDHRDFYCYSAIEILRANLLQNDEEIAVEDFGAGSSVIKTSKRVIKQMARSSLKQKKYAQLLFRMANYYQPKTIIELGTSFGITAAYLASGNAGANLYTCEGASAVAAVAQRHFDTLQLNNIELIAGDFNETLSALLLRIPGVDFAFVDGNHRKAATVAYFRELINHSGSTTMLIFDDIHWSSEMEAAWEEIKDHPAVTQSIDLFFIGIVLLNSNFVAKQHFVIRF